MLPGLRWVLSLARSLVSSGDGASCIIKSPMCIAAVCSPSSALLFRAALNKKESVRVPHGHAPTDLVARRPSSARSACSVLLSPPAQFSARTKHERPTRAARDVHRLVSRVVRVGALGCEVHDTRQRLHRASRALDTRDGTMISQFGVALGGRGEAEATAEEAALPVGRLVPIPTCTRRLTRCALSSNERRYQRGLCGRTVHTHMDRQHQTPR